MEKFQFQNALDEVFKCIQRANKYIDETMPWSLAKDEANKPRLASVMYNLLEIGPHLHDAAAAVHAGLLRKRSSRRSARTRTVDDVGRRRSLGQAPCNRDGPQGRGGLPARRRREGALRSWKSCHQAAAQEPASRAGNRAVCIREASILTRSASRISAP